MSFSRGSCFRQASLRAERRFAPPPACNHVAPLGLWVWGVLVCRGSAALHRLPVIMPPRRGYGGVGSLVCRGSAALHRLPVIMPPRRGYGGVGSPPLSELGVVRVINPIHYSLITIHYSLFTIHYNPNRLAVQIF